MVEKSTESIKEGGGGVPENVRRWANELKQVQSVKDYRAGRSCVNGGQGWWYALPVHLRDYLIKQVAPDEAGSWVMAKWDALPRALRDAIAVEARQSVRLLQGCPWL